MGGSTAGVDKNEKQDTDSKKKKAPSKKPASGSDAKRPPIPSSKKSKKKVVEDEKDEDIWREAVSDYCIVCGDGGDILICDHCPRYYS